ncbi:hypothetical protein BC830DRAFT_270580 [Chytriomyces sp. MP71]|nr:hypothetical protein BC830DRAFT_270580 [Chytriomyces sp. MP71]
MMWVLKLSVSAMISAESWWMITAMHMKFSIFGPIMLDKVIKEWDVSLRTHPEPFYLKERNRNKKTSRQRLTNKNQRGRPRPRSLTKHLLETSFHQKSEGSE